jgi:hypothetical protein
LGIWTTQQIPATSFRKPQSLYNRTKLALRNRAAWRSWDYDPSFKPLHLYGELYELNELENIIFISGIDNDFQRAVYVKCCFKCRFKYNFNLRSLYLRKLVNVSSIANF